jgi:hypothetical protein
MMFRNLFLKSCTIVFLALPFAASFAGEDFQKEFTSKYRSFKTQNHLLPFTQKEDASVVDYHVRGHCFSATVLLAFYARRASPEVWQAEKGNELDQLVARINSDKKLSPGISSLYFLCEENNRRLGRIDPSYNKK